MANTSDIRVGHLKAGLDAAGIVLRARVAGGLVGLMRSEDGHGYLLRAKAGVRVGAGGVEAASSRLGVIAGGALLLLLTAGVVLVSLTDADPVEDEAASEDEAEDDGGDDAVDGMIAELRHLGLPAVKMSCRE